MTNAHHHSISTHLSLSHWSGQRLKLGITYLTTHLRYLPPAIPPSSYIPCSLVCSPACVPPAFSLFLLDKTLFVIQSLQWQPKGVCGYTYQFELHPIYRHLLP